MTFQEARDKLLLKFDADVDALRSILADPELCNDEYKPLREAMEDIGWRVKDIIRLNNVEASARR